MPGGNALQHPPAATKRFATRFTRPKALERFAMKKLLKIFTTKEDGAVTVDWVVMCAAIVMLSVSAIGAVQSSVDTLARALSGEVSNKKADPGD